VPPSDFTLSPAAIEMAAAIIASAPPPAPRVDEDAIARFALGLCPDAERAQVTAALVRSASLRRHVLDVRAAYAAWSRDPSSAPAPATWARATTLALEALRDPAMASRAVRRRLAEAIGTSIRAASAGRLAFARGRNDAPRIGPELEALAHVDLTLTFEEGDAIVAEAAITERAPGSFADAALGLWLDDPGGGTLLLTSCPSKSGHWRQTVSDLPTADLTPGWFRLNLLSGAPPSSERGLLYATVEGTSEQLEFSLLGSPTLKEGLLKIGFSVPSYTRIGGMSRSLRLLLPFGNLDLHLKTWAYEGWAVPEFEAEIPIPGVFEGSLAVGSTVTLQLV